MLQTLSFQSGKDENTNYTNHSKLQHSSSNPLIYDHNTTVTAPKSPLDQLIFNLKHNSNYAKEINLGKLIGFYRIGSEIGSGNFSQVKLGLHLLTKDKVAIKILDKTKLDDKTQRLLLREISSMEKLHHPNIIRLYEVIHRPTKLYICMEYAPEGELYTRIVEHGKINEVESRYIFSQIISAVNHMHKNNICHRDIKAENIFFSNLAPYVVKVGDFGFSINATTSQRLNTYCGSPPYAAPELFRDDSYIGIYVDIWALGILLYFMVTSSMPFRADTVSKLKRMILNGDYTIPTYLSDSLQLLIRGILKPAPADRFNIKEIMDSAWLDGEEFTHDLDAYQISNNIEKSAMKREEIKTKECLDKLGISRDILICCNLQVAPDNNHPYQEYSFNISTNTNPNQIDKNVNLLPIPITPNNSVSYYSGMLISQAKNINIELKQSINGTYRILFHKIQKELRRELNSDQLAHHQNIKYNSKPASNGYIYDYNKNGNDNQSYYDNNSNDFNPSLNSTHSTNSNKKNSLTTNETNSKSIFVKANLATNSNELTKNNIFINNNVNNTSNGINTNGRSPVRTNRKPSLQAPPPHHSKSYNEDENTTDRGGVSQTTRLTNRNHREFTNAHQRRPSFQSNHTSKNQSNNHKMTANNNNNNNNNYYGNNNEKHHSSKFCNIL